MGRRSRLSVEQRHRHSTASDYAERLYYARERIDELEKTLQEVRQHVIENANDTVWISNIETLVDRIDHALADTADLGV